MRFFFLNKSSSVCIMFVKWMYCSSVSYENKSLNLSHCRLSFCLSVCLFVSANSGHPSIYNRSWAGHFGWIPACGVHLVHRVVSVVSCRLRWPIHLALCCTVVPFRRLVVRMTKSCQTTRVQSWLVEILGRFVGSVYVRRGWPAKPNVTQFLETSPDRANLFLRRLHVEVELGWLATEQFRVHAGLRAWHFGISETTTSFYRRPRLVSFHIHGTSCLLGSRFKHPLLTQHSTRCRVVNSSKVSCAVSWTKLVGWVEVWIRAYRLCWLKSSRVNLAITRVHDLVHEFANVLGRFSRSTLALRHWVSLSRTKYVIRLVQLATPFHTLPSCLHEIKPVTVTASTLSFHKEMRRESRPRIFRRLFALFILVSDW